jgi:uroporphyrinogen III methyltransferase/synthase
MREISGKVYLVGAGPGDPGLLTLRGAKCLYEADVVLYDYLASPEILDAARLGAELICLGRHGHGRLMSQTEINAAMLRYASEGRTVVRLKGGDPGVFARLADELDALETAGVPYEVVPGVTAASAASSHAGLPLTDRDEASCVTFVTGHECAEKSPGDTLDYAALARMPGTLVFYMGITTAPHWSRSLIDHGKPATTPVAIARHCSLPDQETLFTTLGELAALLQTKKVRPPAVILVGEVARSRPAANWFTARPLFGRTVLVTRPADQSDETSARLRCLGANVLFQPAIEIGPAANRDALFVAIKRIAEFDWLVFSSSNGVGYFMLEMFGLGYDARHLGGVRLAAIGPATVEALSRFHLEADLQPSIYRAEALAAALAPQVRGQRVLLLRASRGREVLAELLTAAGATVEQVAVYESRDVPTAKPDVAEAMAAGRIDFTTVTSSAIARSLVKMFAASLRKTQLAAISPLTAEVLTELGYPAAIVAESYTSDGLVDAILAATKVGKG